LANQDGDGIYLGLENDSTRRHFHYITENVLMKRILLLLLSVILLTACEKKKNDADPFSITSPETGARLRNRQPVTLSAQTLLPFTMVEFYVDGKLLMTDKDAPFGFSWVPIDELGGIHVLKIIGFPANGNAVERTTEFNIDLSYGEPFGGGRIFYLEGDGEHGLVAANIDLDFETAETFVWGDNSQVGAVSRTDGADNTRKMSVRYNTYAAFPFSYGYAPEGYNDWYIPSAEELLILYKHKHFLHGLATAELEADYWSSTESDNEQALKLNLVTGNESAESKDKERRVRPIRKF
jgi:hypothetical protein